MIRRKGGSWEVVVYAGRDANGRERSVSRSVPAKPGQTRPPKEARDLEATLKVEVGQGHHREANLTVADLMERWLAHIEADRSPTTIHGYRSKVALYVTPTIGNVRLAKLTTRMLDRLYADLRARGLAPATVRQTHAIVRRALVQAQRWGWVVRNVAEIAEPPKVAKDEPHVPSPADVARLRAAADSQPGALGLAVTLAAGLGARRGEVCGLRWADVDLDQGVAIIRRSVTEIGHRVLVKSTKTAKVRPVAIGPKVAAALRARRAEIARDALACGVSIAETAYVCSETPDGAEPLHPNIVSDRFRSLTRRLGIGCRFHDLRHANISHKIAAGIDVRTVADEAGHASAKMTLDVYGHAVTDESRRSAAAGEAALG